MNNKFEYTFEYKKYLVLEFISISLRNKFNVLIKHRRTQPVFKVFSHVVVHDLVGTLSNEDGDADDDSKEQ